MKIKDLQGGRIHNYGENHHDSLRISENGRYLTYENLQNGDGSRFGDYRFVMDDGEVPDNSQTPDALYAECYFNIGGFPNAEHIRAEVINELKEIASIICREYEPFTKTDDAQVNARAYGHIDCAHKIVQMMEQLKEQNNVR